MAELTFEKVINLTTSDKNSEPKYVEKLMIGNEPNNDIWQYYLHNQNVQDKSAHIEYSNYPDITWKKFEYSMTSHKCRNFGIKTFPDIGAIGFYTPLVGNSKFLIPIHVKRSTLYEPPTLSMRDNGNTLTFTITPPTKISYACYRIILQNGYEVFEYIVYGTTLTVDKPTVKGSYTCWCIGYVDEGTFISEDSNFTYFTVEEGTDASVILSPQFYSKGEIDEMIAGLRALING